MSYRLLYHPDISEDLEQINKNIQERLANAIENRLAIAPLSYGKPLAANLHGFWKLRVGDYRIVFKIVGEEVWIFGVIDRRDVYSDIVKRLGWKP